MRKMSSEELSRSFDGKSKEHEHDGDQTSNRVYISLFIWFLIGLFPLIITILMSPRHSSAEDYPSIRAAEDFSDETKVDVESAVKTFKQPAPEEEFSAIVKKAEEVHRALPEFHPYSSIYGFYPDAKPETLPVDATAAGTGILYFFSFSMPEEELKSAAKDARKHGVVMVLRGLHKDNFGDTAKKLGAVLGAQGSDANIDPTLFDDYGVEKVPLIIKIERGGRIWKMAGASIDFALRKFKEKEDDGEDPSDLGVYGPTEQIGEKSMLELIYERIAKVDWRAKASEISERALRYDGFDIPTSKEDNSYYIDPSIVLADDIKDESGKVVFPAGTTVNPVDVIPLTGRYIFINGDDPAQVKFALADDYRMMILVKGNVKKLMKGQTKRFFIANDMLIKKYAISAVPSIISQEQRYIRVDQKGMKPGAEMHQQASKP